MFGRNKKDKDKKKKGPMDRIVMGAIVGTAIGSVIGVTMAPKRGKETREMLKENFKNRKEILEKGKTHIKQHEKELQEIGQLAKETVSGLGSLAKNFLVGKKSKARRAQGLKEIPNEMEMDQAPARDAKQHYSTIGDEIDLQP